MSGLTSRDMSHLLTLLLILPAVVRARLCDLSYCRCEETEVFCEGNSQEELFLSPSSLPPAITALSLNNIRSLHIKTDVFKNQNDMKEFRLVSV